MKNVCLDLREHATKIINYEKKEMIPLTKKEEKKHNKQEVCYICKKGFSTDDSNKKYHKDRDHCHYTGKYRGAAHDICNLKLVSAIFYQIFIFSPNDSPSKTMKNVFCFI